VFCFVICWFFCLFFFFNGDYKKYTLLLVMGNNQWNPPFLKDAIKWDSIVLD